MMKDNQPCDQIDQEIDGIAMAGVLNLTRIFKLIVIGLDVGSLVHEEFVRQREKAVAYPLAQPDDEVNPVGMSGSCSTSY